MCITDIASQIWQPKAKAIPNSSFIIIQLLPPPPEAYRRHMQGPSRRIGDKCTVLII